MFYAPVMNSLGELREAIVHGAVKRLRPKFMTFATTCVGLFPITRGAVKPGPSGFTIADMECFGE
jgi:Cu/Ag efflux pump CusA